MDSEGSLFETTEMAANFLASTTLLLDSWRLCSFVNSPASGGSLTVVDQIGSVGLMGFSGFHELDPGPGPWLSGLVPLQGTAENGVGLGLFPGLDCHGEDDDQEPVMVHAGLLQLFLGLYGNPTFQSQMRAIMENTKSIILTGHSIGGAIASLTTLWLLSFLQSNPSPPQVLCITFGSPLLGNHSLSKALLRQRWTGNFCHVVLKHDIVPRLLFASLDSIDTHLHLLLQYIQLGQSASQITDEIRDQLFSFVLGQTEAAANGSDENEGGRSGSFWPFGNYLFCAEEGAVCVDNAVSVVKLLHLMLSMANLSSCFEDHRKYGDSVQRVSSHFLMRKGFMQGDAPKSSYEAGLALALQSTGLANQESVCEQAKDCLKMVKNTGPNPNLNSARLAISLAKITPHRAQIEWYQSTCDKSDDRMGYYDSFKRRQASKRDNQVNMFRIKLASFWDNVINMIENNELPHDFHKRRKWVNASHFYQLLVEPLDIAEYYRSGEHLRRGHYLRNGRERRHQLFDKWWRERNVVEEESKRSKFASLTQDSCFWARVEEARGLLEEVRTERSSTRSAQLWQEIDAFEQYARALIENKEVSCDVLAKNSSYSLWVAEVRELRSQIQQFHQFPGVVNGEMVP